MKKLLLLLVSILLIGTLAAQERGSEMKIKNAGGIRSSMVIIGFGPKIGINYANITADNSKGIAGISVGGTIEFKTCRWFAFSLDVLYASKGYNSTVNDRKIKEVLSYIDMPVTANFYLTNRLALKIGVQPSIMVGAMRYDNGEKSITTNDWRRFDLAIPVAISYDAKWLWGMSIDLRYNIGVMPISNRSDLNARNSVFALSAYWKF